jgi:hypothetical protein
MQKIKNFNVKWALKDKNFQQAHHFKKLNIKKIYIKKVSMHFTNKFLLMMLYLFIDTTLTYFLSPHFSIFLCDKHGVVISKVHYKSIIFLKFIQFFYDDSH